MSQPGTPVPPPPFARGPGAPPPVPPADPWTREIFRTQIVRLIGAASGVALAVFAIVTFWIPVVGLVISLTIVILRRYQIRLRDYYAAYFLPYEYPEQGALDVGYVLGLVGVGLSGLASAGWLIIFFGNL
ncbi:hypothetical protein [Microlunatus parietis]|uniref:Uncharacterized protein n=1 Tax=Microlunatus parietis TaxID=682979 RepID=A0A7Y9LFS4_9ACTN|nr:hypothetical protein [Microlunatus parietis]NYE74416.1 hypothetical protein [Microlunatus parietis]